MHLVVGEPIVDILNNNFYKSDGLVVTGDQKYNVKNLWNIAPNFNKGSYTLSSNNTGLLNNGTDGKNLGVISNN